MSDLQTRFSSRLSKTVTAGKAQRKYILTLKGGSMQATLTAPSGFCKDIYTFTYCKNLSTFVCSDFKQGCVSGENYV